MKKLLRQALAFLLCAALLCPAVYAAETAANIQLTKTEGTVTVSKSNGKSVSMRANMRLYNGYNVTTAEKSYAWINLDSTKLMKLDASSSVEVRKNGSKLEVNVKSGSVSFDVSEKLGSGESLNVSTSTMSVGIRGTCGWASVTDQWVSEICILEGRAQCVVMDPVSCQLKSAVLSGGDTAQCVVYPQDKQGDKCDILMERQSTEGIPGFVLTELVQDVELCDKILDDSGLDVLADLAKEAGGDPSGRSADGKSASPEVLGQAERVRAGEEAETAQKLDEIRKEEESQENNISKDPVWEQGEQPGSSGGGSSGGTTPPAPVTYTVTFNANGGEVTPATAVTGTDGKLSTMPTPTRSANTGGTATYTFDGWYTAAEGGDKVDETKDFSEDTTLYAHWTAENGWDWELEAGTLTVFGNGPMSEFEVTGSLANLHSTAPWANEYQNIKAIVIKDGITRIGENSFYGCDPTNLVAASASIPASVTSIGDYAFDGCAELEDISFGGTKAQWNAITKGANAIPANVTVHCSNGDLPVTVTFDANEGTLAEGQASAATDTDGKLTSLPTPTRENYTFDGWYTAAEGGGPVTAGYVFTADTTIYAHWTAMPTYTVTFDANGGSVTPASVVTNAEGKLASLPTPTFDNFDGDVLTFEGWYMQQPDGTKVKVDASQQFTEDTVLYARWKGWTFNSATGLLVVGIRGQTDILPWFEKGYMSSIKTVIILDGVTVINNLAFCDSPNLTDVTIPDSVTIIVQEAFTNCPKLTTINYQGTVEQWNSVTFEGYSDTGLEGKEIICTNGSVTVPTS